MQLQRPRAIGWDWIVDGRKKRPSPAASESAVLTDSPSSCMAGRACAGTREGGGTRIGDGEF